MGKPVIREVEIEANGLRFRSLQAGVGPLVLLCHGFPEIAHCWRHQLRALAAAGYHAVAPDMRGYGRTDAPPDVESYSILHLVGDLVGLAHALGQKSCALVGHDWGSALTWNAALLRPDVFTRIVAISVPYQPRRAGRPPIATFNAITRSKGDSTPSTWCGFRSLASRRSNTSKISNARFASSCIRWTVRRRQRSASGLS